MTKLLFDIETNGIDFSTGNWLGDVHTVYCMVVYDCDTGNISRFYDTDGLRELGTQGIEQGIKYLETADELIGHNIIQFDLPVLRKLYNFKPNGRVHDTLVTSRTLYPDRVGGHSLREWGERLGLNKADFNDFTAFSDEMLRYCEQDVEVNALLYRVLNQELKAGDWEKALELEHKIADIIARQERFGFYFEREVAQKLVTEWEEEIGHLDRAVHLVIGNRVCPGGTIAKPYKINGEYARRTEQVASTYGIDLSTIAGPFSTFVYEPVNLESKAQQKDILLELGWKPKQTTKAGGPKLDDSIKEVGVVGEALSKRNVLSHRRSQVQGLIDLADQRSRVHGGANPCGTNTGRMKHMRIVNLPRKSSPLGAEMRGLFAAPPGKILVGYDAASLELRILAHYIGNPEYNEKITSKDKSQDAHTLAARAAGSDDRDLGKTINYALIYGAGDAKLGDIIGGSPEEGRNLRENLYREIPGLGNLVDKAKSAARRGYIITLDGRKLYLRNRVSPLNTLIQGGGAVFMKTVAVHLDELTEGLDAKKVIDMHDEAQWECHPADVDALSSCINEAFARACRDLSLRCPQEAEIKVGKNWAETH